MVYVSTWNSNGLLEVADKLFLAKTFIASQQQQADVSLSG